MSSHNRKSTGSLKKTDCWDFSLSDCYFGDFPWIPVYVAKGVIFKKGLHQFSLTLDPEVRKIFYVQETLSMTNILIVIFVQRTKC